ncbi:hypothetical protein P7K49_020070 [Saguinus oedipus]|uniref:Fibronectin type-III domain-containing protein n=1 Tax=Saguinus oedipus TaxID=9490 RepID=A0ABQ9UZA6_SAGOE|nr:hypothetical protein P7K49_020070 [Saguinus oedipus]
MTHHMLTSLYAQDGSLTYSGIRYLKRVEVAFRNSDGYEAAECGNSELALSFRSCLWEEGNDTAMTPTTPAVWLIRNTTPSADGKSIFEVKGLETNEKYVFAVAAYSNNGKLAGGAIGETTKPILVYPPLSTITARMFLTQITTLSTHLFMDESFSQCLSCAIPLKSVLHITTRTTLTLFEHAYIIALLSVNFLLHKSSESVSQNQKRIKKWSQEVTTWTHCTCQGAKGHHETKSSFMPVSLQIARLMECERVLVALELSNSLNDSSYALQAVTQYLDKVYSGFARTTKYRLLEETYCDKEAIICWLFMA